MSEQPIEEKSEDVKPENKGDQEVESKEEIDEKNAQV